MSGKWLEQIYKENKQELFRFLYVILGDKQSAEDALQETFLKAYLHRSKYVEMQKEKSWLYKIARNTAYDMIRKSHREIVSLKIIAGMIHREIAKVLHMTTGSVKNQYERAINKLKLYHIWSCCESN